MMDASIGSESETAESEAMTDNAETAEQSGMQPASQVEDNVASRRQYSK